jgi:hypothetical protein
MSRRFSAKLGKMRKPQEFIAFASSSNDRTDIIVQSDKSIGRLDPNTGKGVLNIKGCYFIHLSKFMGAEDFDFPSDFVEQAKAACFKPGDKIGANVYMG